MIRTPWDPNRWQQTSTECSSPHHWHGALRAVVVLQWDDGEVAWQGTRVLLVCPASREGRSLSLYQNEMLLDLRGWCVPIQRHLNRVIALTRHVPPTNSNLIRILKYLLLKTFDWVQSMSMLYMSMNYRFFKYHFNCCTFLNGCEKGWTSLWRICVNKISLQWWTSRIQEITFKKFGSGIVHSHFKHRY